LPKMKSHSGAKSRFRLTGSGKIVRMCANMSHRRLKKSGSRKRRLKIMGQVSEDESRRIKELIGPKSN
jgi:large subunit ribosomal protein L35